MLHALPQADRAMAGSQSSARSPPKARIRGSDSSKAGVCVSCSKQMRRAAFNFPKSIAICRGNCTGAQPSSSATLRRESYLMSLAAPRSVATALAAVAPRHELLHSLSCSSPKIQKGVAGVGGGASGIAAVAFTCEDFFSEIQSLLSSWRTPKCSRPRPSRSVRAAQHCRCSGSSLGVPNSEIHPPQGAKALFSLKPIERRMLRDWSTASTTCESTLTSRLKRMQWNLASSGESCRNL
mmetsp:Transcript_18662/g.58501  ORF Transcript_18662/g.58501 Transcript_18662/m.58501 type:complete len:238 (+) Transcript_18662:45-758(+)